MELNSILVKHAGTSVCNDTYKVESINSMGKNRIWSNAEKSVKIWYDSENDKWVISNYIGDIIYYSLFNSEVGSGNVADPWSTDASWTILEYDGGANPLPVLTYFQNPNIVVSTVTEDPVVDESTGDTISITTTTYTDTESGNSYTDSRVVRTKVQHTTEVDTRQVTVLTGLTIGKVYRFAFISTFAQLGWQGVGDLDHGFFRVDKICDYLSLVKGGIDIYANLYKPLGIAKEIFEEDEKTFAGVMFYRLTNAYNPKQVLYMPATFINGTPSSSIDAYGKYLLSIDLGLHQEIDMLNDLVEDIQLLLEAKYGIKREVYAKDEDTPVDMTNPDTYEQGPEIVKFVKYDTVYMEIDDYDAIEKGRKALSGYYVAVNNSKVTIDESLHIGKTIMLDGRPITLTRNNIADYVGTQQVLVQYIRPTANVDGQNLAYNKMLDRLLNVAANNMYLENKKLKSQVSAYEEIIERRTN